MDSSVDLRQARNQVAGRVALQGNMDPLALLSPHETIQNLVENMIDQFDNNLVGYIANLGHGCLPTYDPSNVGVFVDSVHEISKISIKARK